MQENNGNTSLEHENANPATSSSEENKVQEQEQEQEVDWQARFKGLQKSVQDKSLEVKSLRAQNEALAQQLDSIVVKPIEVPEEIDDLKHTDPDKWRKEINRLEQEAKDEVATKRREILEAAGSEAAKSAELERRVEVFKSFQEANPDLKIDDDVIANEVPPRISRKLENGEVTFEEYLEEVKTFLSSGPAGKREPVMSDPNLQNVAGGVTPSEEAKISETKNSYANEIY